MTAANTSVRVGQVWADNDPRCYGREVIVTMVNDRCAHVRGHDGQGGWNGRPSRIRLSALRAGSKGQRTGFHLVKDAQEDAS